MSAYILPAVIISILVYSVVKKVNAYNSFVFGAKTSFDLILSSMPYIIAIFMAIEVLNASGLSKVLSDTFSPVLGFFGIPAELCELMIIKCFSGSGSLAVLENIFLTYGADSYLARAGCVIAGASEAIFYVTAVYFCKTDVSKFRYAIPVALFANFLGAVVGCYVCRFL